MPALTFLGAAGTVTGSKHLLDPGDHRVRWLSGFSRPPAITCLMHGEPVPLEALRAKIQTELGWPVDVAQYLQRVELNLR